MEHNYSLPILPHVIKPLLFVIVLIERPPNGRTYTLYSFYINLSLFYFYKTLSVQCIKCHKITLGESELTSSNVSF